MTQIFPAEMLTDIEDVPEPLRQLIKMSSERAEEIFTERGSIRPQWRALTSNSEMIFIPHPPTDDKNSSIVLVRALLELKNATSVVFVYEGWMAAINGPDTEAEIESIRKRDGVISDRADSVEAVSFVCEIADGLHYTGARAIIRPKHGKAKLGPLQLAAMDGVAGRLQSWLPAKKGKPS